MSDLRTRPVTPLASRAGGVMGGNSAAVHRGSNSTTPSQKLRHSRTGAFDTLPDIAPSSAGMGGASDYYSSASAFNRAPTLRELTETTPFSYMYNARVNRYANNSVAELLLAGEGASSPQGQQQASLPSLYRAPKDHPLRSRKRTGVNTIDEDPTVKALEETLSALEVARVKKLHALDKKNAILIERDRARHEWYQTEFKSAEQLEALRLEALRAELQLRIDALCDEEAVGRAYEEEEESYEYRNELSMLHLSVYSTTVALVTAESERKQNQLKLIEEEEQRRVDTHIKIIELFVKEALDTKRDVTRLEHNDRKIIAQQLQSAQNLIATAIHTKRQADFTTIEKEREREQELLELARVQELLDAEAALEERMRRLDARCKKINQ